MTWLMLAGPPLVVAATLLGLHSVWATFLAYHLGICLLLPWLIERGNWPRAVGLTGGRTRAGAIVGLVLGLIAGGGSYLALTLGADLFLANERVIATLSDWGADPAQAGALMLVMLALNGVAEELWWRGWVHGRLAGWPRRRAIGLTALAYASYHGVTVAALFGSVALVPVLTAVVWGAGVLWGWLRDRYGCVWPALLSHVGATIGYMAVYWVRFA